MANRVHAHATATLLAGALLPASQALALGLGEISLRSFLNEPLRAEVRLLDTRELTPESINVRLAGVEDFDRLGVERSFFLTGIRFEVLIEPGSEEGLILLTTREPVLEPYIDLVIEARWPEGRLLREYTVLIDPPSFAQDTVVVSASERVARAEAEATAADAAPEGAGSPPQGGNERSAGAASAQAAARPVLAPGEMPQRAFSAETVDTPRAGARYMVRRDENLWQIARQARPEGVSVQQAMLDIQRLNPEAFIDGNINRIKAGYIIYLPDSGDISSDDLVEALARVAEQNRDWRDTAPGVTAAASLRIAADTTDRAPSADPVTQTAKRADSAGAGGNVAQDDAATAAAAPDAEFAARLLEMSDRLDTLEQMLAVKDQRIATLEQELALARGAGDAPEQMAAADSARAERSGEAELPAATSESPVAAQAGPEDASTGGDTQTPEGAAPAADTPAGRAQPAQTPAAAPTAPPSTDQPATRPRPAAAPQPSLLERLQPLLIGLLALLLAAAGGLRWWQRRRAGKAQRDAFDEAALAGAAASVGSGSARKADAASAKAADEADDVFAGVQLRDDALTASPEPAPEAAETPPRRRGYGERKHDDYNDESATSDALAEADIYIAYGRYLQAADLLNAAIAQNPDNSAYRLKLLELYVDMGEGAEARAQLQQLRATGDEESIARGEALVSGGVFVAATGEDAAFQVPDGTAASAEQADEPVPEAPGMVEPLDSLASESEEPDASPDEPLAPSASLRAADERGDVDDIRDYPSAESDGQSVAGDDSGLIEWSEPKPLVSLELEDETAGEDAEADPVHTASEWSATTTADSGKSQPVQAAASDLAEPEPAGQSARQQPAREEPAELEFSLDDLDPIADAAPPAAATEARAPAFAQAADLESIEPDFDFPGLAIEGEEDADPEVQEELDLSEALEEGEVSTPPDLSADRRSDEDDMVFAADSDQMATRLDLARAYLDMGDAEGARPILEEVATSASGEHQAEARELLERINA